MPRLSRPARLRQLKEDLRYWEGQARMDARNFKASRAHVSRLRRDIARLQAELTPKGK